MHIAGLPADERFVYLDFAGQLVEARGLHRQADSVEHKPRALLGYPQAASHFIAADPVFGVGDTPDGDHPTGQRQRAILENRADFARELLTAALGVAAEHGTGSDRADLFATALRADDRAIGPFGSNHRLEARGRIGKVFDGFDHGFLKVSVMANPQNPVIACECPHWNKAQNKRANPGMTMAICKQSQCQSSSIMFILQKPAGGFLLVQAG